MPTRRRGEETRRRIVEAAHRLFAEAGYRETTVAEVAAAAAVSVPTVYLGFHSKPALFREAYRFAIVGPDETAPLDAGWYAAMRAEPDAEAALRRAVVGTTDILRRVTPLMPALRGLAGDPELADFERYTEDRRRAGLGHLVEVLAEKQPLRAGLGRDGATDVLLVLLGPDVYRSFILEFGWSEERWWDWTVETLMGALFEAG